MSEATDRPQDRGRKHRRTRTAPAAETAEILERYRYAMRAELVAVLAELRLPEPIAGVLVPMAEPAQLGLDGEPVAPARPALVDRSRLWDLALKLGRELAAGEDLEPELPAGELPAGPRSAPRLSAAQRRQLGGS